MAVKGSVAKQEITSKILETFPNSFLWNDGKEIRINATENGELVQIKVTLTASKSPVGVDETEGASVLDVAPVEIKEFNLEEPTTEEKERLKGLLDKLGL